MNVIAKGDWSKSRGINERHVLCIVYQFYVRWTAFENFNQIWFQFHVQAGGIVVRLEQNEIKLVTTYYEPG
jgi:hypothetical protein